MSAARWPATPEERERFVDWQTEVSEGNTVLGFSDWLTAESESHYAIGIPVAITVTTDGTVTFDFDLTEVSDIFEDEGAAERYTESLMIADKAHIEAAASTLAYTHTVTIPAQEAS